MTADEGLRRAWVDVGDGWAIEAPDPNDRQDGLKLIKDCSDIQAEDVKDAMDKAFERLYDEALGSGLSGPRRLVVTAEPEPVRR